jgi:hypothetical protein
MEQELKAEKNSSSSLQLQLNNIDSKFSVAENDFKIEKERCGVCSRTLQEKEKMAFDLENDLHQCTKNNAQLKNELIEKELKIVDSETELPS